MYNNTLINIMRERNQKLIKQDASLLTTPTTLLKPLPIAGKSVVGIYIKLLTTRLLQPTTKWGKNVIYLYINILTL